jgi:Tol biopolymer transport system component
MGPSIRWVGAALLIPLLLLQAQPRPTLVLSQLVWFDRGGTRLGAIGPLADHGNVELSPDGSRAAVAVFDRASGTRDIWMYDAKTGERTRFTADPADENWLIFSPDGRRVVHNSFATGHLDLLEAPATKTDDRTVILRSENEGRWPVSWSPDGRFLLYVSNSRLTGNDVMVLPLFGARRPYPYAQTAAAENWASFSPDGKWVAFSSSESGEAEVYVSPFPASGRKWRISADGGSQARWRRDGKEIFYVAPDRMLIAATVTAENSEITLTGLDPLFQLSFPYAAYHGFDVAADGQRFLVNTTAVAPRAPAVIAAR